MVSGPERQQERKSRGKSLASKFWRPCSLHTTCSHCRQPIKEKRTGNMKRLGCLFSWLEKQNSLVLHATAAGCRISSAKPWDAEESRPGKHRQTYTPPMLGASDVSVFGTPTVPSVLNSQKSEQIKSRPSPVVIVSGPAPAAITLSPSPAVIWSPSGA